MITDSIRNTYTGLGFVLNVCGHMDVNV